MEEFRRKQKDGFWEALAIHKEDIKAICSSDEEEKFVDDLTDSDMSKIADNVNDMADNDLGLWLRGALDKVISSKKGVGLNG